MDPVEASPPHQIRCDGCSQTTPSYDIVHYGSMEQGYRQLCSRCFNTEVAQLAGLQGFEDAKFEAVGLADCSGELHEFHFRTHLFGLELRSTPSSFATGVRLATSSRSSEIRRTI